MHCVSRYYQSSIKCVLDYSAWDGHFIGYYIRIPHLGRSLSYDFTLLGTVTFVRYHLRIPCLGRSLSYDFTLHYPTWDGHFRTTLHHTGFIILFFEKRLTNLPILQVPGKRSSSPPLTNAHSIAMAGEMLKPAMLMVREFAVVFIPPVT